MGWKTANGTLLRIKNRGIWRKSTLTIKQIKENLLSLEIISRKSTKRIRINTNKIIGKILPIGKNLIIRKTLNRILKVLVLLRES